MTWYPVLLDAALPFMGEGATARSALLMPVGAVPLLRELEAAVSALTAASTIVLPTFAIDDEYERRIRGAATRVGAVATPEGFRDQLSRFDPSDTLLFLAPSCHPAGGVDLQPLADRRKDDGRIVKHLVAFEATSLHTKEIVQTGSDGRVRRIQRFYEPVTWPFPAEVVASLVPVACLLLAPELVLTSLPELRRTLTALGAPTQDVPLHGPFTDLTTERGALAFCERRVRALTSGVGRRHSAVYGMGASLLNLGATIHPTACLHGAVVALRGAVVEAGALVIGPTLLGAESRVEAGGVVAQCLVAPGATVRAGATVRHRVVPAAPPPGLGPLDRRSDASDAALGADAFGAAAFIDEPYEAPLSGESMPDEDSGELRQPGYHRVKAIVEPFLALLALVALSPVFAAVSLLVLATSGTPIFYGDLREGKDGRAFRCWKFRSMRANADDMQRALAAARQVDGPQFKMDHDPRVTPVGQWLRRLNVDELPQLVNVLRGEMSFVGPRPSPFRENQVCVPWRQARLTVRPGITGLWQVCRHDRAHGDFHQWIHYDLLYVRHSSLRVDLKILVSTALVLTRRRPIPASAIVGQAETAHGLPLSGAAPHSVAELDTGERAPTPSAG